MIESLIEMALLASVLAVCFAGPVIAVTFLFLRKGRARALRRSPIGVELLRAPGHSLRAQIDDATFNVLADVFMLAVLPLMFLAMFLMTSLLRGLPATMGTALFYVAFAVGLVIWGVVKLWKAGAMLDHLKAGYDAELAVGQELDLLMRQGAHVFHDFPAGNFNIDHVVIARQGVFAVETKGFTKPKRGQGRADATVNFDGQVLKFPTWTGREPIEQASRQARWLSKWLEAAIGSPVHVQPILALPGWFVERGARSDVGIYSGKELPQLLRFRGAQPLSEQDVQRVAHQVDQKCRTVVPQYSREKKAA